MLKLGYLSMYAEDLGSLAKGTLVPIAKTLRSYGHGIKTIFDDLPNGSYHRAYEADGVSGEKKFKVLGTVKKPMAVSGGLYMVGVIADGTKKAFGSFDVNGNYFCNVGDLDDEKYRFRDLIDSFNSFYSGRTAEEVANGILGNPGPYSNVDNLGKAYDCLKEHGVDPNSVDKLSDNVMNGLRLAANQEPKTFYNGAPNFAGNVLGMKAPNDANIVDNVKDGIGHYDNNSTIPVGDHINNSSVTDHLTNVMQNSTASVPEMPSSMHTTIPGIGLAIGFGLSLYAMHRISKKGSRPHGY